MKAERRIDAEQYGRLLQILKTKQFQPPDSRPRARNKKILGRWWLAMPTTNAPNPTFFESPGSLRRSR
jgi:hypothetical protein